MCLSDRFVQKQQTNKKEQKKNKKRTNKEQKKNKKRTKKEQEQEQPITHLAHVL